MGILDIFFPKYCVSCKKWGSYLCSDCFSYLSFDTYGKCLVCLGKSFDFLTHPGCKRRYEIDGAFSGILYKGLAKKLIYQFKYKPYLSDLAHVLTDLLYENLIQNESFQNALLVERSILVPIPLHRKRYKHRGYNHAALLAKGLGLKLFLETEDMLDRIKETRSQYGLSKKERRENIQGAFAVKKDKELRIKNASVFLVDDILTTGSTFSEAARVLKQSGAKKVWGITLAQD